mmetsp:Transcript_16858/g.21325  ORF Transcript_16858/g.21325 Transcript_16858/m.21325 type:complete len:376 (+) Transcript_16858:47-1174(+)|eukprot:CAMPEP_0203679194 /NCGR_PEP_ID=MMETSP0090-20130426/34711_1 /ASSEMBLY_ACC=CAM_ASM_001088 /TAXON_ID=426623 /ORGANISM="Chaetoceros affinis, Strain CCMP159" /LENGTH=375 /DNA_ID=CAMNT_0050546733 /DNA_START=47 /DNA_END=1174 /DNA_ORIENTATION=+
MVRISRSHHSSSSSKSKNLGFVSTFTSTAAGKAALVCGTISFLFVAFLLKFITQHLGDGVTEKLVQEEAQVLSNLYRDEKQVLSHIIYGDMDDANGNTNPGNTNTDSNGWKPIHIFYGDQKHLAYLGRESQVGQDKLIMALLQNRQNGYFVDLAANDATNLSNTYQLEKQLSWNGICIEPNPIYWTSLSHRKCHVAAAVVGKNRMDEIQFRMYPDLKKRAPSGGIEGFIDGNMPRSKEKSVDLYTVPFKEILTKFAAPRVMDYLSLDVEGSEFFVMEAFPFEDYIFQVMTIERPRQELVDLLLDKGYVYLAANNNEGMETAWVHESVQGVVRKEAIEEVGWINGSISTKWITVLDGDGGKLRVNEPTKKKKNKKN